MAMYFTSDPHVGHRNIIKYCGRPFTNVDEMDAALEAAWRGVIGDDDDVLVVGDVAMGRRTETLPRYGALPGRKLLVCGNHDGPFRRDGVAQPKAEQQYLDAGFDEILHGTHRIRIGRRRVLISHFPYRGDSHEHDRYVEHRPIDQGEWLIHGHVHDLWRQRGRMINVGVDAWAGAPVPLETIAAMIDAGPQDLDPVEWTAEPAVAATAV